MTRFVISVDYPNVLASAALASAARLFVNRRIIDQRRRLLKCVVHVEAEGLHPERHEPQLRTVDRLRGNPREPLIDGSDVTLVEFVAQASELNSRASFGSPPPAHAAPPAPVSRVSRATARPERECHAALFRQSLLGTRAQVLARERVQLQPLSFLRCRQQRCLDDQPLQRERSILSSVMASHSDGCSASSSAQRERKSLNSFGSDAKRLSNRCCVASSRDFENSSSARCGSGARSNAAAASCRPSGQPPVISCRRAHKSASIRPPSREVNR